MKIVSLQKINGLLFAVIISVFSLLPQNLLAAGPPVPSEMSTTMAQILVAIIVALLLAIILLANVVSGAAEIYIQRIKEDKKNNLPSDAIKTSLLIIGCFMMSSVFAADAPIEVAKRSDLGGLSETSFYALLSVIGLELVILLALLYNLKILLAKEAIVSVVTETEVKPVQSFDWAKWWEKFNSLRPASEESNIDLGHDYDGIRELDNRLPPWWLYGFYLSILFAVIYLWRFEVAHSAPNSREELQMALNDAAIEKEEYLKKAGNSVDENTVKYLSDATSLADGKKIFSTTCVACHLADGGGSVGPNMTDNYFIHGGGIKDLFKTIKYGWPEKGMKSWKDDFSPLQIAQLASYVKSLVGTKPEKAKEPQGVLYEEVTPGAAADSTQKGDSTSKAVNMKK